MKVIILSKSSYKEKDCIYNALCDSGVITFMAKGAMDPKSKYVWLNNPLTVAEVEFLDDARYKHQVVKSATISSSPMIDKGDLNYLVSISVVSELANKMLQDEEKAPLFSELEPVLNALRQGKDHLMVIAIFIAKLIRLCGVELEVNKCVICGETKNIKAFNFEEGGFICANCLTEEIATDLTPIQMNLIRYIYKAKDYSLPEIEKYSDIDKKLILDKLKHFIDDFIGVKINSLDSIIK